MYLDSQCVRNRTARINWVTSAGQGESLPARMVVSTSANPPIKNPSTVNSQVSRWLTRLSSCMMALRTWSQYRLAFELGDVHQRDRLLYLDLIADEFHLEPPIPIGNTKSPVTLDQRRKTTLTPSNGWFHRSGDRVPDLKTRPWLTNRTRT